MRVVVIQLTIAIFVSAAFAALIGAQRTLPSVNPENVELYQVETASPPIRFM